MRRILVVDDMAILREPIVAVMRSKGYEVDSATSGMEALLLMARHPPDLVLLDIAMPEMDGLEVLSQMRKDEELKETTVIMLTASSDRDLVVQAAKLGVREFLLKTSFSLDELVTRVGNHFGISDGAGAKAQAAPVAPAPAVSAPVQASASSARLDYDPNSSPAELLKSIKPILTRAQINEKLETCGDLQAMSPIVAQVLTVTNSPTSSANQVARLINQDQAMAIKVLKLANSSVYSRGKPVDTVLKAVTRIGMSQIRQVALNISVMENFGDMDIEGYLSCAAFWEHSIACGLVASEITRAMGGDEIEVDSAFTMGLLHDMGRLVYAEVLGKDYTQVLQTAQEMKLPLDHVELRMLLNNHAAAMEHILHAWNFPKELVLPIVMHHLSMGNIRQMARGHVGEVARLALANNLAHALLLGSSGNDTLYCTEDLMRGLKLNGVVFKGIVDKVPEQTRNLKNAMVSESGLEAWKPQKDVVREQLDGPVHSLFVSETPQLDAFAVFFRQIQDKNFGEPPNLGVVHILNVRERDSLTLRFNEMEAAAGISNLPLIVFSPNGNIGLEERTMSKREHVLLPTPIAIARVTDAINYLHAKTGVSVGVGV